MNQIGLYIMSVLYILAGLNHFKAPRFYIKIIPPFLPFKSLINQVSGLAEIALGALLLFESTRIEAAWGIIVLLILVLPANVYHLYAKGAGMKIPLWALWFRLPFQGVFIYWAYLYTY